MNILIIGGTRFVGYQLVLHLLEAGRRVTILNRGVTRDDLGSRVERLVADRTDPQAFARALGNLSFDAVVDFAAYTGEDARHAVEILHGRAGHYIFISTGQVYLVRENCPKPARESDYAGTVMPEPDRTHDRDEWLYGVRKRAAEDILAEAWRAKKFPATRLRIPMVNGERDYYRRIESYLWRFLDGGPVILPLEDTRVARHVYGRAVVRAISGILGNANTFGEAFNLAQDETPTIPELISLLGELTGAPGRVQLIPASKFREAGIAPAQISPFNAEWMSFIDPGKAKKDLGFTHEPLRDYLTAIVRSFLENRPSSPPENYAHRPGELALAAAQSSAHAS
jgi:nucleoside-diphosphate-sugar epimerase